MDLGFLLKIFNAVWITLATPPQAHLKGTQTDEKTIADCASCADAHLGIFQVSVGSSENAIAEKSRTLIGLKCDFCSYLRYTLSEYTKYSFARDALTGTKIPILNLRSNPEKEFLSEKGAAKRRNTGVLQATRLSLRRKVDISTMSVRLFSAIFTKHQKKLRKQGQNFKEWLLFTRYKQELPKWLLALYYFILIINFSVMLYFGFAWNIEKIQWLAGIIVKALCVFDGIAIGIFWLLSWRPGERGSYHEQWVPRPKKRNR